jgi:hypothetical protein
VNVFKHERKTNLSTGQIAKWQPISSFSVAGFPNPVILQKTLQTSCNIPRIHPDAAPSLPMKHNYRDFLQLLTEADEQKTNYSSSVVFCLQTTGAELHCPTTPL